MTGGGPLGLPPLPANVLDLVDDRLGLFVYARFIEAEAEKLADKAGLPITATLANSELFHEEVRLKILSFDSDTAEVAGLEKALKRVANGDLEGGGRMFRQWLTREGHFIAAIDEAKTGRRKQSMIGRRPRVSPLQSLIVEIMRAKPDITQRGLLRELDRNDDGTIARVTETQIEFVWPDGHQGVATIQGLKDRMTRARREIKIATTG